MLYNRKTMDKVQIRSGRPSPEPSRAGVVDVTVFTYQLQALEVLPLDIVSEDGNWALST